MSCKAKEPQNQIQFDEHRNNPCRLGPYSTFIWRRDPKHLCFLLARYKFVAKMLEGRHKVVEIGVGDAIGVPIVAQEVSHFNQLRQVAKALGLKDAFGASDSFHGTTPKQIIDLLTFGVGIDAFFQQDLKLRDRADKVHPLGPLQEFEVRINVVLLG